MTTELPAGWYRDPSGAQNYWDGQHWSTPAPPTAAPGPTPSIPPTSGPPPAAGPPPTSWGAPGQPGGAPVPVAAAVNQAAAALRRVGVTKAVLPAGLVYGGLVVALLSLFMPWTTVSANLPLLGSMHVNASPFKSVWMILPLALIGVGAWLAWPALTRRPLPTGRLAGLAGVNGGLALCWVIGLVNYLNGASALTDSLGGADADAADVAAVQSLVDVSLNFGYLLYTAAVAALIAGLVLLWRTGRAVASPAGSPAPAAAPPPYGPAPMT